MLENEEKIQGEANELLLACKEWRWLQPTETTMDIKEFADKKNWTNADKLALRSFALSLHCERSADEPFDWRRLQLFTEIYGLYGCLFSKIILMLFSWHKCSWIEPVNDHK